MDLRAADIDALLKILRDRAADPDAWQRLAALKALESRTPLPDHAVAAVADALLDPDVWIDSAGVYDCAEAYERRYIDQAAGATLLAHGAAALPQLLRVWLTSPRQLELRLQEFLERVDPTALARVVHTPPLREQVRHLLAGPALPDSVRKILEWSLAQLGSVSPDELLAHPSAEIRAAAATDLGARGGPGDFERLLEFAASEPDARPACAAVRALATAAIPPRLSDAALRHLPPLFRDTTTHAHLELCAFLLKLGPRAERCAAELARLTIAPSMSWNELEVDKIGSAAAYVLRGLPELPDIARHILRSANPGDSSIRYRVELALGRR